MNNVRSQDGTSDARAIVETQEIHQPPISRMASSHAGPETASFSQQDAAGASKTIHSGCDESRAASDKHIDPASSPCASIGGTVVGQGSAGAANSMAPAAAFPEHTTDVQQQVSPYVADAQDTMAVREDSLAAEPSLAHHASAVPTVNAEHGPYVSTTFEIHQLGDVKMIVLDLPCDGPSAACILGILARRLNMQPGAIEMEFAGHEFSGDMVLPNSTPHTGSMPIIVHVRQNGMSDTVDLSAPATPMQLQVVVRNLGLNSLCKA